MSEYNGFSINNPPNVGSMYKIASVGSGALPKMLQGMYTTPVAAKRAIDNYLGTLETEKNRRAAKAAATKAAKKALAIKGNSDG